VYAFEAAVALCVSTIAGMTDALAGARARIGRLRADLVALGLSEIDIAALPRAAVDVRTTSDGFGWAFVVERQILLAGLIRRFLASQLREAFSRARSYFDTHADGGARFREFGTALNESLMRSATRPDEILAAARRGFEAQFHWYARKRRPSDASHKLTTGPVRTRAIA
jgi:heme oxygenase